MTPSTVHVVEATVHDPLKPEVAFYRHEPFNLNTDAGIKLVLRWLFFLARQNPRADLNAQDPAVKCRGDERAAGSDARDGASSRVSDKSEYGSEHEEGACPKDCSGC